VIRELVRLAALKAACFLVGHRWGAFYWCARCGAVLPPRGPGPSTSLDE
jgi:hypothetical protein